MSDLWYKNLKVLLQNPHEFYPKKSFTNVQKSNALARLGLYIFLIVLLLDIDRRVYIISLLILLYSIYLIKHKKETFDEKPGCQMPTKENPFMNFTVGDYYVNPEREGNCDVEDEKVQQEMRNNFVNDMIQDPNDIWGRHMNERNFYTMPNTEIVNDQKGFAEWLYGSMGQCKENGKGCLERSLTRTGTSMYMYSEYK